MLFEFSVKYWLFMKQASASYRRTKTCIGCCSVDWSSRLSSNQLVESCTVSPLCVPSCRASRSSDDWREAAHCEVVGCRRTVTCTMRQRRLWPARHSCHHIGLLFWDCIATASSVGCQSSTYTATTSVRVPVLPLKLNSLTFPDHIWYFSIVHNHTQKYSVTHFTCNNCDNVILVNPPPLHQLHNLTN